MGVRERRFLRGLEEKESLFGLYSRKKKVLEATAAMANGRDKPLRPPKSLIPRETRDENSFDR